MEQLSNYLDGQLAAPRSGRYLDNFEPATGQVYSHVPDSDEDDLAVAVSAAEGAFKGWRATPAEDRAPSPSSARRPDRRERRRAGPRGIRGQRKADIAGAAAGYPSGVGQPQVLRGGGDAVLQRSAPDGGRRDQLHPPAASRRGGLHLSVESAALPVHLEDRARAQSRRDFRSGGDPDTVPGQGDVVAQANDTTYGLAASVWSQDISRCHRLAARLDSGLIWVNTWMLRDLRTPMGGMKHSGVGREGGFETLRFFTEPKNVCIKY